MNKIFLMGRIARDLELKHSVSGVPFCNFAIAVPRNFSRVDGNRETDFINVIAWRRHAEFINKYFSKGKLILIVGSLRTRYWENQGIKRQICEVSVEEVNFCDGGRNSSEQKYSSNNDYISNDYLEPSMSNDIFSSDGFDDSFLKGFDNRKNDSNVPDEFENAENIFSEIENAFNNSKNVTLNNYQNTAENFSDTNPVENIQDNINKDTSSNDGLKESEEFFENEASEELSKLIDSDSLSSDEDFPF